MNVFIISRSRDRVKRICGLGVRKPDGIQGIGNLYWKRQLIGKICFGLVPGLQAGIYLGI